jgi:hypothetical protein
VQRDEAALAQVVAEDLEYLATRGSEGLNRTDVRISSTILRRLMVEGDYPRSWRALGFKDEPTVTATDLRPLLRSTTIQSQWIHYAYAGGKWGDEDGYRGLKLIVVPREYAQDETVTQRLTDEFATIQSEKEFTISKYLRSASAIVAGQPISRRDIIEYVANKLGGAHFDSRRREREIKYQLLDENHVQAGAFPAAFVELLAMVSTLASSSDAERYVDRAHKDLAGFVGIDPKKVYFMEGRGGRLNFFQFTSPPQ